MEFPNDLQVETSSLDQVIKFCKSRGALITDAFLFKAGAPPSRRW